MKEESDFCVYVCVLLPILVPTSKKKKRNQQGQPHTQTPASQPKQPALGEDSQALEDALTSAIVLFKLLCPSTALWFPHTVRGLKAG